MRCRTGCMSLAKTPAQSVARSRRTTRSGPIFVRGELMLVAGAAVPPSVNDGIAVGLDALVSVGLDCGFRNDASSEPTLAGEDEDGGWLIAVLTILTERAARTSVGRLRAASARNHWQEQRAAGTDPD